MDGDVAVAIPGALDFHCHFNPKNLLLTETADRGGPDELTLDIIEHGIWGECRHPGLSIMGVAGGDMVGDDLRQIVGDIGCHGDLLCTGYAKVLPAPSCQFPSGEVFPFASLSRWVRRWRTRSARWAG